MLSTSDIIELYDGKDFDTLVPQLGLLVRDSNTVSQLILEYAIQTRNIELFSHVFTADNFYLQIIRDIDKCQSLHQKFEHILATNLEICDNLEKFINTIHIYYCNYPLLRIIMKYAFNINNNVLELFFYTNIRKNNLDTVLDIITYGFNTKFNSSPAIYYDKIKITSFVFLEKHNFDISSQINEIGKMYCYRNNIDGIIFCLNRGADVNYLIKSIGYINRMTTINFLMKQRVDISYLLKVMDYKTKTETLKFLIEHGADIKYITVKDMFCMDDINIVTYLVDLGLNIVDYLDKLMICAIDNDNIELVTYYINMGCDVHSHNELFLFYAVDASNIEIIKLLLDVGADIHGRNNSILLFSKDDLYNEIEIVMEDRQIFKSDKRTSENDICKIFNLLLDRGAVITDPQNIYDYVKCMKMEINENILNHFLEAGLDLNILPNSKKSILISAIENGKIKTVELLLKHNINLGNTYDLIKIAIRSRKIIQMILNVIDITPEIADLLRKSDPDKKLIY